MKILILLWIAVWLWPGGKAIQPTESVPALGPLTAHEKILLGYRLDINRLSAEEMEILPGIGPATAQKIAAFREKHGPFENLESMLRIRGIGPQTVKNLTPWVSNFHSF